MGDEKLGMTNCVSYVSGAVEGSYDSHIHTLVSTTQSQGWVLRGVLITYLSLPTDSKPTEK